jgi:predicted naringenin-chalcone synthase
MALSRDVPARLANELKGFVEKLCKGAGLSSDDCANALFAVHPGGPKILDFAQSLLGLRSNQVEHSRRVLLERGNMSSATLPHIWMNLVADSHVPDRQVIVSLAFGPGLTICGAVLRKVSAC